MNNLQTDKSYDKVIDDLNQWERNLLLKIERMYENVLTDMNQTFNDVHYFASFTNALLIEQENQLEKATTNEEIDLIQQKIDLIIAEVQLLQSLSFGLNTDSVKLTGKLQLKFNNQKLTSSIFSTISSPPINNNYRFLISRHESIELEKNFLPIFYINSSNNELINDCILTFNIENLDEFFQAFTIYWNLFPDKHEIRMLIPQYNISFIIGKLGETSRLLIKRFQLDQIKVYTNSCPKSDERILYISGKQRHFIKDCIEEIYFNLEEKNKNKFLNENIQLYNPSNLTNDDINKIMITNIDYGGFIQNSIIDQSRIQITDDEEDDEDDLDEDLWDENDDWWNYGDNNSETIEREMIINNVYVGVIIGVNATRIERIKQKTGANIYISDESSDLKRTVTVKGTRGQVDRAYAFIENLIERYKNGKLSLKSRLSTGKRKGK